MTDGKKDSDVGEQIDNSFASLLVIFFVSGILGLIAFIITFGLAIILGATGLKALGFAIVVGGACGLVMAYTGVRDLFGGGEDGNES